MYLCMCVCIYACMYAYLSPAQRPVRRRDLVMAKQSGTPRAASHHTETLSLRAHSQQAGPLHNQNIPGCMCTCMHAYMSPHLYITLKVMHLLMLSRILVVVDFPQHKPVMEAYNTFLHSSRGLQSYRPTT